MFCHYLKRYIAVVFVLACLLLQKTYAAANLPAKVMAADTAKGVVVDSYSHAIAGVKISIAEQPGITAISDVEGGFEITAARGNTLIFAYPGHNIYKHTIKNSNPLKIRLLVTYLKTPDTIDVLYNTVAAENVLGSVSTIYTNQITTTPATIFPYALTGRLPGLYTQQLQGYRSVNTSAALQQEFLYTGSSAFGNGPASDNSEILNSLRGQSPVTIIDGVQREFSSLDFESIESISVLKDALSTIMLGQVSSNGVILVTTKKPRAGKPRIAFTAQTGVQEPLGLPKPLSSGEYAYLYNEALQNTGAEPVYTLEDYKGYSSGSNPVLYPDVDWFKTITRKYSPISRFNFSLNGGSNVAKYVVALGYMRQEGMLKHYDLENYNTNVELNRYTINSNIEVNLGKNFNIALQLFGRIQDGNQPGATLPGILTANTSSTVTSVFTTPNNAYPIYNNDGSFGGNINYTSNLFSRLTRSGYIQDYGRDAMVNLDLTYKFDDFVKGLWVKMKGNLISGSTNIINRSKAGPVFETTITATGDTLYNRYGTVSDQSNRYALTTSSQFWYAQVSTGIDRQFGLNNLSFMLFADQRQSYLNFDLPAKSTNLAGKTSYNYNNKYFAEAALTYSGFDRYEPGIRFGWFYAGGLGWKISEEDFIKDNAAWINLLKVRATYGRTGNANIGYFSYRTSYSNRDVGSYLFGATTPSPAAGLREVEKNGAALTTVGATWEKANKFNIGFDLNILNNTLRFSADYYHDKYYDLMQQRGSNTTLIGSNYPNENIGINLFTGGEFMVTYQNHLSDFNYFITANTSVEQTKVLYQDEIQRQYDFNKRTGQAIGRPFGYVATGLIQTPEEAASSPTFDGYHLQMGDIKYVDQNGDGRISPDFDAVPISTGKPRIYYGANLGFSYKGFDFSVLLQGVHNRVISLYYGVEKNLQINAQLLDRWTPVNRNATWPRLTMGGNTNNSPAFGIGNTFYERSGNYFRIKNVDIGYNLPYKWVSRLGVSGLRIFANGLNLFTSSANDFIDPETFGNVYPIQRVINTGVSIKL